MSALEDYTLNFRAPNGVPSKCRIRIFGVLRGFHKADVVIICQQLIDDPGQGMSVTNAAETIATEVIHRHEIQPMRLIWIEHYPAHGTKRGDTHRFPETLDRVTFDVAVSHKYVSHKFLGFCHARWTHGVTREFIEELIGESF